jgi:hypothetical protein
MIGRFVGGMVQSSIGSEKIRKLFVKGSSSSFSSS